MSDQNDAYGRGADIDGEISDILSEVSGYTGKHSGDDSISEMARRYGVNVSGSPAYSEQERRPVSPSPTYRSQPREERAPSVPKTKYDDKGARIVYDAGEDESSSASGRIAAGRAAASRSAENTVPLSVAERRRMIREKSANVRVLYDADTATHASKDAPFEQIGAKKPLPPVGDGRERRETKKKKKGKPQKPAVKTKKAKVKVPEKEENVKENRSKNGNAKNELPKSKRILKAFIPWNGDSKGECVRKIVMDVSFLLLLICALYFTNYFIELSEAIKLNTDTHIDASEETQTADKDAEAWAEMRKRYPDVTFPEGMMITYADLYGKNQDTVGYVNIDGTGVWGAVVQGEDNEFYLKHNFYKTSTRYGQLYMDYRNDPKELSDNTIVYGHHMKDGLMFAQLTDYEDIEFFKKHPVIEYNTLYANYQWKICAVFVTNNKPSDDNGYMFNIIVPDFYTKESLKSYITAVKQRSLYDTGVDWDENDKFISLITCAYDFDDERFVVIARQVRDGEPATVNVDLAKKNESPRYPQKWYDVKGLDNPYADAPNWEPNA